MLRIDQPSQSSLILAQYSSNNIVITVNGKYSTQENNYCSNLKRTYQYSRCQGTATEETTIQTGVHAKADTRPSSASNLGNVEVVSRESVPPEWACVWGVGGCEVVGGNEVVHVKAKKKNMV